jgi:hypothetical protein
MVLGLKAWESRSLPGLPKTLSLNATIQNPTRESRWGFALSGAVERDPAKAGGFFLSWAISEP